MDAVQMLNEAPLKAVFLGHFMLTTWAMIADWLPIAYFYYNTLFMLCLLWAMHSRDAHDPILLATLINILSIVMDAIAIGVKYESSHFKPWFGFSVFMAITNLLLRPISSLVLYRVYNERQGRYSTFGFPGLGGLASTGPAPHGSSGRGSYENLDHTNPPHQSVPSPIRDVESQNFAQK